MRSFPYCYYRLDKELAFIEKHNKVSARWTTKDERYQLELQVQVVSKCQELVGKMKPVCQERFFLLKLKEKYSGESIFFLKKQKMERFVFTFRQKCDDVYG